MKRCSGGAADGAAAPRRGGCCCGGSGARQRGAAGGSLVLLVKAVRGPGGPARGCAWGAAACDCLRRARRWFALVRGDAPRQAFCPSVQPPAPERAPPPPPDRAPPVPPPVPPARADARQSDAARGLAAHARLGSRARAARSTRTRVNTSRHHRAITARSVRRPAQRAAHATTTYIKEHIHPSPHSRMAPLARGAAALLLLALAAGCQAQQAPPPRRFIRSSTFVKAETPSPTSSKPILRSRRLAATRGNSRAHAVPGLLW